MENLSEVDFPEDEMISAANMESLVKWARQDGKWDFTCRNKQIVLITCLEDSTNEVELHELSFYFMFISD